MPPKQTRIMVAAVASEETSMGDDLRSFQLPSFWEDRSVLWFNQMDRLMRGRNIINRYY